MDHKTLVTAAMDNPTVVEEIKAGRKISAIKCLRQTFGLGLKEAKDVVEEIMTGSPDCCGLVHCNGDNRLPIKPVKANEGSEESTDKTPPPFEPWDSAEFQLHEVTPDEMLDLVDLKKIQLALELSLTVAKDIFKEAVERSEALSVIAAVQVHGDAQRLHKKVSKLVERDSRMVRIPF